MSGVWDGSVQQEVAESPDWGQLGLRRAELVFCNGGVLGVPVLKEFLKVELLAVSLTHGCFVFRYGPRGPGFGSRAATSSAIHSTSRSSLVTPAAIAGVTCSVLWIRQKL